MGRPETEIKSSQDRVFDGSTTIDNQVGFYDNPKPNIVSDVTSRAEQLPSSPDDRLTNVFTPEK